ncbi:MAG: hypothetical protein R6V86_11990 [Spirochaetia bacterium]
MDMPLFPAGRKLFYLFPQGNFHQSVVQHIIREEYEVYTLSDYKRGLPLIFQYNGAIIFINLDTVPGDTKFITTIRDFSRQSSNRSIDIFLITHSNETKKWAEKYLTQVDNCSTLMAEETVEGVTSQLDNVLSNLHAQGQRKYVRFGTNNKHITHLSFFRKEKRIKAFLHDVSTAGLSFTLEEEHPLSMRSKLTDITIDLGYTIEGLTGTITIKRRLPNNKTLHVLLFDKTMDDKIKEQLRFVIHASLQRQFTARMEQVAVPE